MICPFDLILFGEHRRWKIANSFEIFVDINHINETLIHNKYYII